MTDRSGFPTENRRNFVGLPLSEGTITRGTLWRSDNITVSPDAELADLFDQGLRRVIDLRASDEVELTGTGVLQRNQIQHIHRPMTQKTADPQTLARTFRSITSYQDVGDWYLRLTRARAATLVASLHDIADSPEGVLFYCTAGKDRTGVLAAVILLVAGASDEVIIDDYQRTAPVVDKVLRRHELATGRNVNAAELANHPLRQAHPDSMAAFLRGIHEDGGILTVLADSLQAREDVAGELRALADRLREALTS